MIIERARHQLSLILDSIIDLKRYHYDGKVKKRAFGNILTVGRSTSFVLQNLRSVVGKKEFNEWYEPKQKEMQEDQLLRIFVSKISLSGDCRNSFCNFKV